MFIYLVCMFFSVILILFWILFVLLVVYRVLTIFSNCKVYRRRHKVHFVFGATYLHCLKNKILKKAFSMNKCYTAKTNAIKKLVFYWGTSHIGIRGNGNADIETKQSLRMKISNLKMTYTDFKSTIN